MGSSTTLGMPMAELFIRRGGIVLVVDVGGVDDV